MEGKEKERKKGRKESSFPSPEWCPSSLQGKERNPLKPSVSKGKGEGRKGKKEERDGFRIRFLRGIQGKKDGRKEGKRMERMLFFSLSGGLFSLQKKEEIQWFQGKEKGKKKEKKDEVDGLEDGIFRGRLEEWKEGRKERRRPCKMGVSQGPQLFYLFCFL